MAIKLNLGEKLINEYPDQQHIEDQPLITEKGANNSDHISIYEAKN